MKNNNRISLFAALMLCMSLMIATALQAQTSDTTAYSVYAYMKVAPGMEADYIKMEKAYKKIHLANKKAGNLDSWSVARVLSPGGANCEYNYVARNGLVGNKQLANYYEGNYDNIKLESILTKEEIALVNRTDEIRTLVKEEVWSQEDGVFAADFSTGKIAVWNYFSSPAGKTRADHFKVEKDIWKPIHAARVKESGMKAWVLLNLELPFGASQPYNSATIDLYADMQHYLAPWFDIYFKKIHPGKDIDKLLDQTEAATTLVKGEVRMVVDRLDWK